MNLALFDFDGTITRKDSMLEFLKYAVGRKNYYLGLLQLSPGLLAYLFGYISNDIAKQRLVSHFFKGWNQSELQEIGNKYALQEIPKIVRKSAIEKIRWHQHQGDQVVVVTASIDLWLMRWCDEYKLALISTQLEAREGAITGCFASKNCFGPEKAVQIKKRYQLSDYDTIYAYGDSRGDREMLELASIVFYKEFSD